jgi:L-aminopeptidase/D-esterase-like protein
VVGSYCRLLFPAVTVCSIGAIGTPGLSANLLGARVARGEDVQSRLLPRLNFTGTAAPAFIEFSVGRLSTGWKNPVNGMGVGDGVGVAASGKIRYARGKSLRVVAELAGISK